MLSEDAPIGVTPAQFTSTADAVAPGSRLRVFGYPQTPPQAHGAWVDVDLKGNVGGQLIQVESRSDQTIKPPRGSGMTGNACAPRSSRCSDDLAWNKMLSLD